MWGLSIQKFPAMINGVQSSCRVIDQGDTSAPTKYVTQINGLLALHLNNAMLVRKTHNLSIVEQICIVLLKNRIFRDRLLIYLFTSNCVGGGWSTRHVMSRMGYRE